MILTHSLDVIIVKHTDDQQQAVASCLFPIQLYRANKR